MWPFVSRVRPAITVLRLTQSHWNRLNQASANLAHVAALLLALGGHRHDSSLTNFAEYSWPTFSIYHILTVAEQYHIHQRAAMLAPDDSARMFTAVRDFAIDLHNMMAPIYRDILILTPLTSIRPSAMTARCPRQQSDEVFRKWGNLADRDEELYTWLERAAGFQARAAQMVRSTGICPVPVMHRE